MENLGQSGLKTYKEYPNWEKAPLSKENGELVRVAKTFYDKYFLEENQQAFFDIILERYNQSQPQNLTDEIWSQLKNSESWSIQANDFREIEGIIGSKRDWFSLKESFEQQKLMEMPIIAHLPDGTYHLLSGNTRLCLAKTALYRPKVIILEFPEIPQGV